MKKLLKNKKLKKALIVFCIAETANAFYDRWKPGTKAIDRKPLLSKILSKVGFTL